MYTDCVCTTCLHIGKPNIIVQCAVPCLSLSISSDNKQSHSSQHVSPQCVGEDPGWHPIFLRFNFVYTQCTLRVHPLIDTNPMKQTRFFGLSAAPGRWCILRGSLISYDSVCLYPSFCCHNRAPDFYPGRTCSRELLVTLRTHAGTVAEALPVVGHRRHHARGVFV